MTAFAPRDLFSNADVDAAEIGDLYRRARSSVVESVQYLIEAGRRLEQKKKSLAHGEWLPWLAANAEVLGFEKRAAQLLIKGHGWVEANAQLTAHLDETKALQISRRFWLNDNVRGTAGTGENEWFTPADYLKLARSVLGGIDLDPATHLQAQTVVQASRFFTKQDDGLSCEWHGRVWLNPPYAQPLIAEFVSKMCAERSAGRVTAAIMLTHNYTDTSWFHEAAGVADAICFTRGRVKFYEPDGDIAAPTQGQAFFYFGQSGDLFAERFRHIGFVVRPAVWP